MRCNMLQYMDIFNKCLLFIFSTTSGAQRPGSADVHSASHSLLHIQVRGMINLGVHADMLIMFQSQLSISFYLVFQGASLSCKCGSVVPTQCLTWHCLVHIPHRLQSTQ